MGWSADRRGRYRCRGADARAFLVPRAVTFAGRGTGWLKVSIIPKGGPRLSEKDDAKTRAWSIAPDAISSTMLSRTAVGALLPPDPGDVGALAGGEEQDRGSEDAHGTGSVLPRHERPQAALRVSERLGSRPKPRIAIRSPAISTTAKAELSGVSTMPWRLT